MIIKGKMNMKRTAKILCSLVGLLALSSCGVPPVALDSEDYVTNLEMEGDEFRVLQLTDIHWSFNTDMKAQSAYLTALVEYAKPDCLMITGDSLLDATKDIATRLYSLIDSFNIPYGVTYGNHDMQGLWSTKWMNELISSGENAIFKPVNDRLHGETNFVANVKKDGKTVWQLYGIDSNTYVQRGLTYEYDRIQESQVEWYVAQAEKAKRENGGQYVPAMSYFHIPLWEWAEAWYLNPEGELGELNEKHTNVVAGLTDGRDPIPFYPGDKDSTFFEEASVRGMKGMFTGHDHANDWVGMYEGVLVGYGVKTGNELYYSKSKKFEGFDLIGGSLASLKTDGSFKLEHIYMDNYDTSKVASVSSVYSPEVDHNA